MFDFHSLSRNIPFNRLTQNEDGESLSSSPKDEGEPEYPVSENSLSRGRQAFIALLVLLIAAVLGAWLGGQWMYVNDRACLGRVSNYSPLFEDIGVTIETRRFNGSLMHENIYRQTGLPEVDAAWEALGTEYRSLVVPSLLASRSSLSDSQVQINPKYGGGFLANVEGLYHLHCLNLLRQSLYFNYAYYSSRGRKPFGDPPDLLKVHVTQCLDILRQQLMCTVDIGIMGQIWYDQSSPRPLPDFNTNHKCRNFEDVRRWAEERQVNRHDLLPMDFLVEPRGGGDVLEEMH